MQWLYISLFWFKTPFQLSDMEVPSDLVGAKWTKKDCCIAGHGDMAPGV